MTIALACALVVSTAAAGQTDSDGEPVVPVLDGLAWYHAIDTDGPEIEATRPAEEVEAWSVMLDDTGGTFEDLEYAFYDAFDPAALPRLGSLATVRIAGAETDALRSAVVADIVAQAVALGVTPPEPEETTLASRDVVIMTLPEEMGFESAIVYAAGDSAWVLLMPLDDATRALQQLP